MEVDSDSSSGSVIITGPIPEYPELRRRPVRTSVPARNGHQHKRKEPVVDITQDEKVEKIKELEDLVKATATLPRTTYDNRDDDVDAWSESDTKSIKGIGKRDPASKYLKKIKTLQQNKRRQETRISRLTKEVRSLRDKVSVQAAYIDVLCGMLGDDMKEKFRDRQGMGILGNTKIEEDNLDGMAALERGENGTWAQDDPSDKTPGLDGALKEKEREFYCVEDLDEVEENGMSRAGSSEELKEATEVKDETIEDDVRPLDIAGPSTSYGIIGNRITGKEVMPNEMRALTIAVGKQDPARMMCNTYPDGNQMDGNNVSGEIHHGVFGTPYERRLCVYEGQVGESVFAQVPKETSKDTNPYGEMRVQVAYVNSHRESIPPVISYGMVMGNRGLNLLPAVHPTTDDPLNIGSDDTSSFGPLIISTSLDPLNLIAHPSATDGIKISQATPSSSDPLNIGSDEALVDDPRDLTDEVDPIAGRNQSTALLISLPPSTDAPPHAASDNGPSEMSHQPMETESILTPQPSSSTPDQMSSNSTITGKVQVETPTNSGDNSRHSPLHSNSQDLRPELSMSMPQISDIAVHSNAEHQDDDYGNISHPQAIVDHLINNISCDLSPDLRLE